MKRALTLTLALSLGTGCSSLLDGSADLKVPRGAAPGSDTLAPTPPAWTPGTDFTALDCQAATPSPAPTRRLSHVEYRYVLEDLFGDAALARTSAQALIPDPVSLGFSNSAQLLDVKSVLGQQYMETAEKVATSVTADLTKLLPCNPASGEAACAKQFIDSFVARAYRRPLVAEEVARYVSGYESLRTQFDFRTGIEWVVSTVLQSPNFLYRPELDEGAPGSVRKLTPHELASRLSFLIWHSLPDAGLLAAADEGRLSTPEDVEREARRLLADARGQRVLNFFEEWLDVDKLGTYSRDAQRFTNLPAGLPDLLRSETRAFLKHVLFEGDARFPTLLTADFTFANQALAQHYGLTGISGTTFQKVQLPASRRGVWMQGGPLTSHDKATRTSIVNRGLRVRTALLCHNIPSPPDNVNLELGPVDANASQADRLAQHRSDPACASCHGLLDPVGQVFENVDAVGRFRTQDEAGRAVVTQGELTTTKDSDGPVADGADMMQKLSQSEQVRQCFATQLFRYTHGREEQTADGCSQKQAYERFVQSGHDVRELIVGVVLSDDFLYRSVAN